MELWQYARGLLALGTYTLKQVAEMTGLGKNTVKDIDLKRLKDLYTIDGTKLIRPEKPVRMLAIDEFKLHNGHRYATHIIAHATYRISSGRMEGINNKIKVFRRQDYGLPDDDYFFLRLFDASRKKYVRNPLSHKICD